jgi:hypothetical protein
VIEKAKNRGMAPADREANGGTVKIVWKGDAAEKYCEQFRFPRDVEVQVPADLGARLAKEAGFEETR